MWLLFEEAVLLSDAAALVAFIAVCSLRVADADVVDTGGPHVFRTARGVAKPGQPGALELIPRATTRPRLGYPLAAPFAGMAAERGGGDYTDVFGCPLDRLRPCDEGAVRRAVAEARAALPRRRERSHPIPKRRPDHHDLDPRTDDFLSGQTAEGARNRALYYAVGDMLRAGRSAHEAERELLAAARRCGLTDAEARATFKSGLRRARGRR